MASVAVRTRTLGANNAVVNNLGLRTLTGVIYVALTLGAAWAGPFTTMLLFLPICMIAASELHRLIWPQDDGLPAFWSMFLAATVQVAVSMGAFDTGWTMLPGAITIFLLLILSIAWMLMRGTKQPANEVGGMLLMMLYIGLPFGLVPHLFTHSVWVYVGFMLMLWANDTGAYLVGRSIGRTKLLPKISPNKTVEGFFGGLIVAAAVGYLLSMYHDLLTPIQWIVMGIVVGITSSVGDLLESAIKRASGVKDSGTILPGHGGMLDRFDGFLIATPAVVLLLWLVH